MRLFSVFMMSCTLMCAVSVTPAMAQAKKDPKPVSAEARDLASSSAYRLYDQAVVECFTEVMKVNPFEAAKNKDMSGMNMDRDDIMALQDCMNAKGVDANFENYYGSAPKSGSNSEGMSAAQKADLEALEKKMQEGRAPSPALPTPTPSAAQSAGNMPPPTMAPARDIPPPPAATPPATTPEEPPKQAEQPTGGSEGKTRSKSGKYWNSGE